MPTKRVRPSRLDGSVEAPPSKSMTQRAVLLAALAEGDSRIEAPSTCDDAQSAIRVAIGLGATMAAEGTGLRISGMPDEPDDGILQCGESGFCARAAIPIASLADAEYTITGTAALSRRPLGAVETPMRDLGAYCATSDGKVPVVVRGPLRGGSARVDGSSGSQFVSGLLMALPLCPEDSMLSVAHLKSKPYVRMTMGMLSKFGAKVGSDRTLSSFAVEGGQAYRPTRVLVEGDWSGAAFMLVAGALAGKVKVKNLDSDSQQADKAIVGALKSAGAKVKSFRSSVVVEKDELSGFSFDATDCPDLMPPLVALAAGCEGVSRIAGASRLRAKESDRAAALRRQFAKIGSDVKVVGDSLVVRGGMIKGGTADSEGDHRIAMACAVAGLISRKGVTINGAECVSKSYPEFFGDLGSLAVSG